MELLSGSDDHGTRLCCWCAPSCTAAAATPTTLRLAMLGFAGMLLTESITGVNTLQLMGNRSRYLSYLL
jgi:hypothetical protein